MLKVGIIIWASYFPNMLKAQEQLPDVEIKLHTLKDLEEEKIKQGMLHYLEHEADIALIYTPANAVWDELAAFLLKLKEQKPVFCWGADPSYLVYSSVTMPELELVQQYVAFGGLSNMLNLFKYLKHQFKDESIAYALPQAILWQGIYSTEGTAFAVLEEYLHWSKEKNLWHDEWGTVGILFHRSLWQSEDLAVINLLIDELNKEKLNVLPVFTYGYKKPDLGAESSDIAIEKYFFRQGKPIVNAVINFLGSQLLKCGLPKEESDKKTTELLQKLNVPVLKGIIASAAAEDWRKSSHGLGAGVVWNVAMPEFDGIIEPLMLGTKERIDLDNGIVLERSLPIEGRCSHAARRLSRWVRLQRKKPEERKIIFVLHNNPCSGLEASVGSGANLDTIESVAYIMHNMQEAGYKIDNLPENGKELIDTIMNRKAIGDFRWTPIEEIIEKKGAVALLDKEVYRKWFKEKVSPAMQEKINKTWGALPGEAMVKDDKLVITGVEYGNVLVVTQPKRGCLGAKCDGEACKILHDPDCPPTHHYLASYWYWDKIWGADAIVHVGTHGNLEFLPGKSVGLSGDCFPDLAIGDMPNLYIYSMDNPPEGTIAKRRSYAVLVDHLIPVMTNSGTYDELKELENHLAEYGAAKDNDPAKAHSLEHVIVEAAVAANLHQELKLSSDRLKAHDYGQQSF
ncbi:MAG: cobaltochelatase subunit CobN, partial [bacterium]